MRRAILLVVLMVPTLAFGRTSVRTGGGRGHRGRGGLSIHHGRTSGSSSWSLSFRGGTRVVGGRRYGSGSSGAYYYSAPGVTVYRGWVPYHPGLTSGYVGYSTTHGVGPYSYVDGVHFGGTGGVQVFRPGTAQPLPPPPATSPSGLARLSAGQLIDRGDDLFGRGDYAGAVAAYHAAAAKAPNDPMTAYALGHGLFAVGDYTGAAAALRRGVQLYPGLVKARMRRRDFYGRKADFDAQLARLEKHLAAKPGDGAARFVLGYTRFFSEHPEKAREHFVALGPRDTEAQLFVAELAAH